LTIFTQEDLALPWSTRASRTEGRSNREVANLLNISPTTVETHRSHILQKLDIHSIPELVLYAVRKGIIS
jgi:two-component system response regulator NreC